MSLDKLTIEIEGGGSIKALYNPSQLKFQKNACWELVPKGETDTSESQFTHGEPATLEIDLFFDTFEKRTNVKKKYTDKIYHLTTVEKHGDLHRPPLVKLHWGNKFEFGEGWWILTSLNQTFTLFLEDGTPVRATLGCSFRQWRSVEVEARLLRKKSADVAKSYTVRRGDTLSAVAAQVYEDPRRWRPIAEANAIDNPRRLEPGRTLTIPRLTATAGRT